MNVEIDTPVIFMLQWRLAGTNEIFMLMHFYPMKLNYFLFLLDLKIMNVFLTDINI
jgi:hypothetical protein